MKNNLIKAFVDIIYPRRCPVCGDIVAPRGELICSSCSTKLMQVEEPRCKRCSKSIDSEEKEFCHDCETKNYHYVQGFALWIYDSHMKKSISDFKFHGKREYSDFYVDEIVKKFHKNIQKIDPDVLVPIPIHKTKQQYRGYNQADILAQGIGKAMDIPVITHLLQRDKKTLPQKQLNDKERLKNLEKAFVFNDKENMKWGRAIHKVILIDDIYTTGSTIEACTNILLQNGIEEVYFISLCIGKGF